jgi:hypothetical protein
VTVLQSLEQTAAQIANSCSLPFEEPTVMYLQAALLVAGEERRYTELSYVDRHAEGVELTLLIVTPSRVIRVVAPSEVAKAGQPGFPSTVTVVAETWPLSSLRRLRLEGSAAAWEKADDKTPLPNSCALILTFETPERALEELRLPTSPEAGTGPRRAAAELMPDFVAGLR